MSNITLSRRNYFVNLAISSNIIKETLFRLKGFIYVGYAQSKLYSVTYIFIICRQSKRNLNMQFTSMFDVCT